MGTDSIPSDSVRLKVLEMFDKLGPNERAEIKPAKITTGDIRDAMRKLGEQKEPPASDPGNTKNIELASTLLAKIEEALAKGELSAIDELMQEGKNFKGEVKPVPMPEPNIGNTFGGVEVKPVPMPEPNIGNTFDGVEVKPELLPDRNIGEVFDGLSAEARINDLKKPLEEKIIPVSEFPTEVWHGPYMKDAPDVEFF